MADSYNHTIRQITPAGVVTTLAGLAGSIGSADGTGSAALFDYPCGVAVDSTGNVYVADGSTIRRITPAGSVATIGGFAGVQGGLDGVGSAAQFAWPSGVAVDNGGNVYVADSGNNRISKGLPLAAPPPPQLLVQPESQSVVAGTNAVFFVAANGAPPLSYQWLQGSNLLAGATNATLVLSNVQPAQAGDYFVVVSNPSGSVTSAPPAALTVLVEVAPTLTWTNPAPIVYGTALGTNQLNATASVPGTFVYSPPARVLSAGTSVLAVVFTPLGSAGSNALTGSVALVVLQAPLTVTANNATRPYGATNPPFTGTITGLMNGDNITATCSCTATPASPAGTYPIVAALADPDSRLGNYAVVVIKGTLTVTAREPVGSQSYAFANFAGMPGGAGNVDGTGSVGAVLRPLGRSGGQHGQRLCGGYRSTRLWYMPFSRS